VLELYTFRVSHFSEKARWMLDASRTEYREVCWTPMFHLLPALWRGRRGTTVPILRTPGGYVQDSTRILHWLDTNMPGFKLLPQDAQLRREALEIEERFDRVGVHVMRYAYGAALDKAAVLKLWTLDASTLQRRLLKAAFPLARAAFRSKVPIDPASVAHSRTRIAESLDFLDQRLADGRSFLVGERLSIADITAAALLAPLFGPAEHEIYGREEFRQTCRALVADWNDRPAAGWLRGMYRAHRLTPGPAPA
jgi:glutathione S-transferase